MSQTLRVKGMNAWRKKWKLIIYSSLCRSKFSYNSFFEELPKTLTFINRKYSPLLLSNLVHAVVHETQDIWSWDIAFTFSHLADAFIQYPKRLTIGEYMKCVWINWFILRGKQTEEVLVIPSLRHCSNKCNLAREGMYKEKDKVFFLQ